MTVWHNHEPHRAAAVDFNVLTAVKGSWVCDSQSRIALRYGLLTRKTVFERLAVKGHGKAADFVQLFLNVQTAGNDTVAEILRIVGVGEFVVSVRLGIQPALDVSQDGGKGGCVLPCREHRVGHLDIREALVATAIENKLMVTTLKDE